MCNGYHYRYQSFTAQKCLDEILNIQPKDSSGGGGETRESVVSRQAAEMLEKLPPDYIPHEVSSASYLGLNCILPKMESTANILYIYTYIRIGCVVCLSNLIVLMILRSKLD